jgi:hypothetical protein
MLAVAAFAAALAAPTSQVSAQAKTDLSFSRQPGILYMPTHVIEDARDLPLGLIAKHRPPEQR